MAVTPRVMAVSGFWCFWESRIWSFLRVSLLANAVMSRGVADSGVSGSHDSCLTSREAADSSVSGSHDSCLISREVADSGFWCFWESRFLSDVEGSCGFRCFWESQFLSNVEGSCGFWFLVFLGVTISVPLSFTYPRCF